jgi:hypothetical protein
LADKQLETLAYRLKDLSSLRNLFSELNFDFADKPVNKDNWNDDQKKLVQEARVIASKDDFQIYYIQTNTDSLKEWKAISTKIIKENHGLCMICSHNPSSFKWIFSSLSKEFSKSFSETRHVPIDIKPDLGVPKTFVDFLEKIKISKDSTGTSIVSQISRAFDSFAIQIHDELTVNVFEALKLLSEGIISDKANNLTLDEQTLEEIREPVFILLYRIIFILYAEDRNIFPTEQKTYQEKFSFKWLKENWLLHSENQKKLSEYDVQNRLWKFFRLIELGSEDLGYDSKEFFMRAYYGRLFDRKMNSELENWRIQNNFLLEAINLLTRTQDKKGNYFFLDYSALETRHLGSIYEHLLEFHLTIKNKKIDELPNPKDRKSSGSYYTPKYVVNHIVKNTIEPTIKEIIKNNVDKQIQIEKILSLKILDPAMGSGHFLAGAVEYLATRLCQIEFGDILEDNYIERKRDVVRRCIYGVDINPLAVDLARLSLWLETLSSDKPLSFLSAHLKTGNSLIGMDLESIFDKQTTLFESEKGRSGFKKNLKKFLMFEGIEDNSASAVKLKLEEYSKLRSKGTIYHDLKFLLDCKIGEFFNLKIPNLGDYHTKIGINSMDFHIFDEFPKITELSKERMLFHWELEFPQIFYDEKGGKKYDSGFDIIIGNPPYTKIPAINRKDKSLGVFLKTGFFESATGSFDLSALFIEKGFKLLNKSGRLGFIATNTFFSSNFGLGLRKFLTNHKCIESIINFEDQQVFDGASTYTTILCLNKKKNVQFNYASIKKIDKSEKQLSKLFIEDYEDSTIKCGVLNEEKLDDTRWLFIFKNEEQIISKLKSIPHTLNSISEKIAVGLQTSADSIYVLDKIEENNLFTKVFSKELNLEITLESEILKKFVKGSLDVKPYDIKYSNRVIIFPYTKINDKFIIFSKNEMIKKFPKCYEYLKKYEKKLKQRTDCPSKEWWGYTYPRNLGIFEKEKIMTPFNAFYPSFALDEYGYCYSTGIAGGYSIISKEIHKIHNNYLIGLLNSILLGKYLIKKGGGTLRGNYISYEDRFIRDLPIAIGSKSINSEIVELVSSIQILKKDVKQMDEKPEKELETKQIETEINDKQCKIDTLVFKLYNLDEKETQQVLKITEIDEITKNKIITNF